MGKALKTYSSLLIREVVDYSHVKKIMISYTDTMPLSIVLNRGLGSTPTTSIKGCMIVGKVGRKWLGLNERSKGKMVKEQKEKLRTFSTCTPYQIKVLGARTQSEIGSG